MNYNLPYSALSSSTASKGILGLFGRNGITLSGILSGTQKTINFMNQAIPLVKQVGPVWKNAKTMFQVMNEFKKVDTPQTSTPTKTNIATDLQIKKIESQGPTFFLN